MMERYSDRAIEIINELHTARIDYENEYIPLIDCANQCAAYEDTGMTPEAFQSYVVFLQDLIENQKASEALDRFRQLVKADKDGRVVALPCKVGDTLFRVFAGEILEHKVRNMRYLAILGRWDIDTTPFCSYVESSIGKTIFLTREEAEAALEAMKDE